MKYFFLGKIFLYELNAYTDAYLADQLLLHASGKKPFSKLNKRLQILIETFPEKIEKSHIVGLAYCQYLWNGFYDYMYARLFRKIFGFMMRKELKLIDQMIDGKRKKEKTTYSYNEFGNKKIILITPLIELFGKKLFLLDWYLERNKFSDLNYKISDFSLSMQHVQTQNIKNNLKLFEILSTNRQSGNLKVKLIRKASKELGNKPAFIKACAKTLKSASRWDRWFKSLLVALDL